MKTIYTTTPTKFKDKLTIEGNTSLNLELAENDGGILELKINVMSRINTDFISTISLIGVSIEGVENLIDQLEEIKDKLVEIS